MSINERAPGHGAREGLRTSPDYGADYIMTKLVSTSRVLRLARRRA
jgi:hypothetical protein